jgi:hypothetical protein
MIVWLASYPRSGNTLLRQVLKCCFDRESYEDLGPVAAEAPGPWKDTEVPGDVRALWGHRESSEDRDTFYERCTQSAEVVFVKTHESPSDDQKAIYIIRDGRLALESFVAFQDHYHPGDSTCQSLLFGDHRFGSWSDHYRRWLERSDGQTLVVRFEELVEASPDLLARLAQFIGHDGPVQPWVNPQARLRQAQPAFYREGRAAWNRGPLWTDFNLKLFFSLHGRTMVELGYADQADVERHAFPADSCEGGLIEFSRGVTARRWELQRECDLREACSRGLKQTCEDRLALIHDLEQTCAERLDLIHRLSDECEQRLQLLHQQRASLEPAAKAA